MSRRRRKKRRGKRDGRSIGAATATQETPEQAYRRWESMESSSGSRRFSSTLNAIKQSSWVYSAVTFISEHIMRTPVVAFAGGKKFVDHPHLKLIERPNSYADQNTSSKFRYSYFMELLLHGAVMRVFGDMQGFRPGTMAVRPRWHFRCTCVTDEHARQVPVSWRTDRFGGSATYYEGDTCYHDALYNPLHDFEGLAPLTAALLSVANDCDVNEFASRFFQNDGSTGTVFSTEHPAFNQAKADDAAKKWKQQYSGLNNAFSTKFIGFGLRPFEMGRPLDAKMLQTLRTLTREEIICGIFKIPLDAISASEGGGDIVIGGPSGGTQASAREAFLVNVVMPWAMRYDEEFERDVAWRIGGGVSLRHDFTSNPILERRRLERARAAVELIDRGVVLNEVIRWLALEISEQPHGNDWWVKKDRLPARLVLDAGREAARIAIPDPVKPQRKEAQEQHIGTVISLAQSREFAEQVRGNELIRANGNGKSNAERIREILGKHECVPLSAGSGAGR